MVIHKEDEHVGQNNVLNHVTREKGLNRTIACGESPNEKA